VSPEQTKLEAETREAIDNKLKKPGMPYTVHYGFEMDVLSAENTILVE
jgi:hypothetical protein